MKLDNYDDVANDGANDLKTKENIKHFSFSPFAKLVYSPSKPLIELCNVFRISSDIWEVFSVM